MADELEQSVGTGSVDSETAESTGLQGVQGTSTVRNPDRLLELYESQKAELKELKAFKAQQEAEKQALEAKRLEEKGQYEALIPLKVEEALKPVNQSLEAEKKRAEKLATELAKIKVEKENLEQEYRGEKLKSLVNPLFRQSGGKDGAEEFLWAKFGGQFDLNDGKPVLSGSDKELSAFFEELKKDPVGALLFEPTLPEGSGTNPQTTAGKGSGGKAAPRVVTAVEALNPRKAGFTLEDIASGAVVIKN